MNHKASYVAVATALDLLTDDELIAVAESPDKLKGFAAGLVAEIVKNTFVVPMSDEEAIVLLVAEKKYDEEKARLVVVAWRKYAAAMGYTGPVAWRVKAGFEFKKHSPLMGPCCNGLSYLQGWNLLNDEPTQNAIIFWVPRLAEGSLGKNISAMEKLRGELRQQHGLPAHHCGRFGSIAQLFALILAHFKRVGERVPLKQLYAASDTLHADGDRVIAGSFDGGDGLSGNGWWHDKDGGDDIGFFLLGVEPLGE